MVMLSLEYCVFRPTLDVVLKSIFWIVKSLVSDNMWHEHIFISGSNHHLKSQFRINELGLRSVGLLAIGRERAC